LGILDCRGYIFPYRYRSRLFFMVQLEPDLPSANRSVLFKQPSQIESRDRLDLIGFSQCLDDGLRVVEVEA
jgi:hypothetical protein